ncbi:MAG: MoxR family ATPase [Desulfobacterales bacterium]|nr:MoxR family ATPase [Desulfobacterales bacterium]
MATDIKEASRFANDISDEIHKVIIGQDDLIKKLMVALLADGHVLLEGLPGLAKTLTVKTLAQTIEARFQRIQFTPDLLPADVIGTQIYNPREASFSVKKGPVFTNILLADEINRAPAKVQSALLEAMGERQVTIGEETFKLDNPFLVLATQNPIEQEGTYPLPEAQVDRFMLKVAIDYPDKKEERAILERMAKIAPTAEASCIVSPDAILDARKVVEDIYISDELKEYIVDIVFASRKGTPIKELEPVIECGASPRATIALTICSKALAFIEGRDHVRSNDIKKLAHDIMRHRIIISYEGEAEGVTSEDVIAKILSTLPTP